MKAIKNKFLQIIFLLFVINDVVYASQEKYSLGSAILKLIFYIIVIIIVLVVTVYGTKFIARNSKRFIGSKYMKLIDILNLGANIKILIVEIKEYVYILAITNNSTEMLEKLPKDEFEEKQDFEEHFSEYKKRYDVNYRNIANIPKSIKKILNISNKSNDKEDKYDEENH
ncbi:flagellar biosynthetic protein FliO [Schnuerera sp. xch1]|uniref:flagellar biosynthetic protein FliO n=1 Tax=Schnuerera sp. xch1 TaxID=2874283 RepID=UPI001CBBC6E4|nr:flagellar biosynthetic protein FliO [Schnuerera sp. xch1]MBZ2173862.1 flagellar biosynthetic protein FliO [Schnuerera sp. xch1]